MELVQVIPLLRLSLRNVVGGLVVDILGVLVCTLSLCKDMGEYLNIMSLKILWLARIN